MIANQITKVQVKKKDYILTINNKTYIIDEFLYQCILPYEKKVLEVKDMLDVIAFSEAHQILLKLYRKIFLHTISKYDFVSMLYKNDISTEYVNLIVNKLTSESYLNDLDFVEHYIYIYQYNKGKKAFSYFLSNNHISQNIINGTLERFEEDTSYAIDYANRYANSHTCSTALLKQKIKANLINKGFSENTIKVALENIAFEKELLNLRKEFNTLKTKYPSDKYKIMSKLMAKGYHSNDINKIIREEFIDEN